MRIKVGMFEKVCLNLLGICGGFALGFILFAITRSEAMGWLGVVAGIAFGNWAWISLEHEKF